MVQRFLNEARAVNDIRHPRIVEVLDAGRLASGTPYFVMEHLAGESLAARLRNGGRLPPAVAVGIARQIAGALGAAHARSCTATSSPRTCSSARWWGDGAARRQGAGFRHRQAARRSRGRWRGDASDDPGAPGYAAVHGSRAVANRRGRRSPHRRVCARSDRVRDAERDAPLSGRQLGRPAAPPHTSRARLRDCKNGASRSPAALEAVVRRALAKEPGDRLPSMAAFDEALSAFDVPPGGAAHAAGQRV